MMLSMKAWMQVDRRCGNSLRPLLCMLAAFGLSACATVSPGAPASELSTAGFSAEQPTVLITGSNRGIGLALARYYAAADWNVIATARRPDASEELAVLGAQQNVVLAQLDVTDLDRIDELAGRLSGVPIDLLINNAAVLGELEGQQVGSFDFEQFEWTMAVNVYGPMAMAEAFRNNVAISQQKKIATLTSGLGSLTIMGRMEGMTYYRVSKTGINMGMRAIRASYKKDGIIVALIAPGMVDTQLLSDSGYRGKSLTPADSAAAMAAVLESLTLDDKGTPTNFDGSTIPW